MFRPGLVLGVWAVALWAITTAHANHLSQPEVYLVERATSWTVGLGADAVSSPGALAGPSCFLERSFELSSRLRPVVRLEARKLFDLGLRAAFLAT